MQSYYESNLLANQFAGAIWTAALAVLAGNWLLARRGEATTESFKGLFEWYLPANVTKGLLMMLAVSALLLNFSIRGNVALYIIVSRIVLTAFVIQGFAANDRRMRRNGASRGRRQGAVVLLVLLEALLGNALLGLDVFALLAIAGGGSALFGSRGAARPMIDHIKEKMKNIDDE